MIKKFIMKVHIYKDKNLNRKIAQSAGVVAPDRALSMGQIEQHGILMLN